MIRFKSKAAGDVLMLQDHADRLLQALGREPAPRGIFEVQHMGLIRERLQQAIDDDARRRAEQAGSAGSAAAVHEAFGAADAGDLPLRQRWWPMMELLRHAQDAEEPIVWGV